MEQNYEMEWTKNEIVKDIEAIGTRISKHEFTQSQIADITDAISLIEGNL